MLDWDGGLNRCSCVLWAKKVWVTGSKFSAVNEKRAERSQPWTRGGLGDRPVRTFFVKVRLEGFSCAGDAGRLTLFPHTNRLLQKHKEKRSVP